MSRSLRLGWRWFAAAALIALLAADQFLPPPLPGGSHPAHLAPHAQVVLARDGTPLLY